jgi:adhesin transport system membrane fusion protein
MGKSLHLGDRTLRYLATSVLLEESGSPVIVRLVIWTSVVALASFLVWAHVMDLDEVSRAPGEVVPMGQVKKVQHLGGGSIAAILVHDGKFVREGETLLRLDPVLSRSQFDQTVAQMEALQAQRIRLEALIEGKQPDFSPIDADSAMALSAVTQWQQVVMAQRMAEQAVKNEINQARSELDQLQQQEDALRKQRKLLNEEMSLRSELVEKGLNSKTLYISLQRKMSEMEGEIEQLPAKKRRMEEKMAGLRARAQEQLANHKERLLGELATTHRELRESEEVLRRHRSSLDHLEIRAPIDGYVHGLKKHTVGEVVASGDTILEMVPLDRALAAEVRIAPKDIGHVAVGQPVVMKFTTYDFSRYGGLEGKLDEISPTSMFDDKGSPYYKGVIRLAHQYVGMDQSTRILPGLTLQAEIITGRKSVLQYLLKPIFASAREAMRER